MPAQTMYAHHSATLVYMCPHFQDLKSSNSLEYGEPLVVELATFAQLQHETLLLTSGVPACAAQHTPVHLLHTWSWCRRPGENVYRHLQCRLLSVSTRRHD